MSCDGKTYTLPLNTWADGSAENAPEMSGFSANAGTANDVATTAMQMVLRSFMVDLSYFICSGYLILQKKYTRQLEKASRKKVFLTISS